MRILIIIITMLLAILKLINAEVIDRDKCDESESEVSLKLLISKIEKSIEVQKETSNYLQTLEKSIQNKIDLINADIKDIKEKFHDKEDKANTKEINQQQAEDENFDNEDENSKKLNQQQSEDEYSDNKDEKDNTKEIENLEDKNKSSQEKDDKEINENSEQIENLDKEDENANSEELKQQQTDDENLNNEDENAKSKDKNQQQSEDKNVDHEDETKDIKEMNPQQTEDKNSDNENENLSSTEIIQPDSEEIKFDKADENENSSQWQYSEEKTFDNDDTNEDSTEQNAAWQSDIEYIREHLQDPKEMEIFSESIQTDKTAKQLYDCDTYLKSFDVKNDYKSWTIVQRRQDGSVYFNRNWNEYKIGFGDKEGEFFAGLDKLHNLTTDSPHELLIILEDFFGNTKYAHYDHFAIGSEREKYQLQYLGEYHGNAGDYLRSHLNMFFSTKDRDNDVDRNVNCAQWFEGGWWYDNYYITSNLNGPWRAIPYLFAEMRGRGVTWGSYSELRLSYKTSNIMIRSKKE